MDAYAAIHAPGQGLAHLHPVPRAHQGLGLAVETHEHGDDHLLRSLVQGSDGLAPGALFMSGGVDPAKKGMFH